MLLQLKFAGPLSLPFMFCGPRGDTGQISSAVINHCNSSEVSLMLLSRINQTVVNEAPPVYISWGSGSVPQGMSKHAVLQALN